MRSYQEIKACFVSAGHLKSQYTNSHCILPISVGNAYHENEKFAATIKLINKYFSRCTIMICDTLQRHRLAMDNGSVNSDFQIEESIQLGQDWLLQQQPFINALAIPNTIFTWNQWLDSEAYLTRRKELLSVYQTTVTFRAAFDETIDFFVSRYMKRQPSSKLSKDQIVENVYEYVTEECAVMSLWSELNAKFEIYPGKQSAAMAATQKFFVHPKFGMLLQRLHVNFTKVTRYYNLQEEIADSPALLCSRESS